MYDGPGRVISTPVNKTHIPGEYSVIWNGQGHPSGIYICRLQAGDFMETRKLVLQKVGYMDVIYEKLCGLSVVQKTVGTETGY
jgi:hypothetical protein